MLLAGHVVVAQLCKAYPIFSTFYAIATLVFGLTYVLVSARPERAAYVAAYIAGAEVLWRMTKAGVLWEYGKYATVIVLFVGLVQAGAWTRVKLQPLFAFLVLMPSAFLTVGANEDFSLMRSALSFNLSGPLALFVSIWFFSSISLSRAQLSKLYVIAIAPICGVAAIGIRTVLTNPSMTFKNVSNFAASGGFGPNQVAASLSLGVLLCFLYVITERGNTIARAIVAAVMVALATQSALTFSRAGVVIAAGAIAAGSLFFIRVPRTRIAVAVLGISVAAVTNYFVLPMLRDVTSGAITERFQNTDPDGRDVIMQADIETWAENPILGVGPGVSSGLRTGGFEGVQPHTEFTRLLAEHGVLGAVSILLLLSVTLKLFRRARTPLGKAYVVSLITWTLLYMTVNAMRLVAPAFCIGLASLGYAALPMMSRIPRPSWAYRSRLQPAFLNREAIR
jgi:hypothetical protein